MGNPIEAVGSGKFPFFNSDTGLSGKERVIQDEAFKAVHDDMFIQALDNWFNSLTQEEAKEFNALSEASEKDSSLRQKIYEFQNTHGKHQCILCKHYGIGMLGQCAIEYELKRPFSEGCDKFKEAAPDDGIDPSILSEDDIAEMKRLEKEHPAEFEELKRKQRRKMAIETASKLTTDLPILGNVIYRCKDHYKRMYDEFPDVFAKCTYKTFDDLMAAIKGIKA